MLVRRRSCVLLSLACVAGCASSSGSTDGAGGAGAAGTSVSSTGGGGAGGGGASSGSAGGSTSSSTSSATTSSTATTGAGGAGGGAPAPHEYLGLTSTKGWPIYAGGGYRYGPSIMVHPDASVDIWTCSPGANGAWDFIRTGHSTDGGHSFTDVVALQPTPGSKDAFSTCDPGVVKIGAYYYVGYTSTENPKGTQNELYLARGASPTGPFEKWSGTGWGNAPKPIVTYGGSPDAYGIGEPSLVLQGGKLFVYYTNNDETGGHTDLSIVDDPSAADWPAHLQPKGHVIAHAGAQDSIDVKYVDALGRFLAVSTFDRFGPNATVAVYESDDGVAFTRTPFRGARVQPGAHNMGLSGDESGHIPASLSPFIAYAYQPPGSSWGNWPTFLDPVSLDLFPEGTVVGGGVSSIVGGSDWAWSGPRAWDGVPGTVFSSLSHGATAAATEWAFVDVGRSLSVASVTLTPRPSGLGYPVDFVLQSSDDAKTWTDIPGASFTGHANPGSVKEILSWPAPVTARFFRVLATKLGADDNGNHYLQLGEIEVGLAPP